MLHELALHPVWPFSWIYPSPLWIVTVYICLLTWCCLSRPFKPARTMIIAALFILGGLHSTFTSSDPTPSLSLLDVGDGEAILLQTPGKRHILVDTGGKMQGECLSETLPGYNISLCRVPAEYFRGQCISIKKTYKNETPDELLLCAHHV